VKYLLLLLLLTGCASVQLTEEEIEEREYYEQERALAYLQWKKGCAAGNGIVFAYKPWTMCRRDNCIPHKRDWDYDYARERPKLGNTYTCVSRAQLRNIFR